MLAETRPGRHRSAARHHPAAELVTIVTSAGHSAVKASVVLAASGGLVAAFALPAHATAAQDAPGRTSAASTSQAAPAVVTLAPAVVAPAAAAPAAAPAVGIAGVTAVAKPRPKPRPAPRPVAERVSVRVADRAAVRAVAQRPTKTASRSKARPAPSPTVRPSSSKVVSIARGLLGIPYKYGGESPSGFDCSGFTQYVFGKAGVSLPRTASAQQRAATRVSSPKPGDLVFFGSPAWHVGIYTGSGKMIDSPRKGKSTSERPIFSGVSGYGRF